MGKQVQLYFRDQNKAEGLRGVLRAAWRCVARRRTAYATALRTRVQPSAPSRFLTYSNRVRRAAERGRPALSCRQNPAGCLRWRESNPRPRDADAHRRARCQPARGGARCVVLRPVPRDVTGNRCKQGRCRRDVGRAEGPPLLSGPGPARATGRALRAPCREQEDRRRRRSKQRVPPPTNRTHGQTEGLLRGGEIQR